MGELTLFLLFFAVVWVISPYVQRFIDRLNAPVHAKLRKMEDDRRAHLLELEGTLVDIHLNNIPSYMKIWTENEIPCPISSFRQLLRDGCIAVEITENEVIARGKRIPHKSVRLDKSLFTFK